MERVIWKSNMNDDMIMNITPPNCPRCGCSNTKFCYYNNYSLTQPRYFCKGCRRYWTKGGSLRNVPVGGACRKPRRCHTKSRRSLHETTTTTSTKGGNFSYNNGGETSASNYGHDIINGGNISNSFLANDGSHIDLALVYSNFLSQKPDLIPKTGNNNINYDIPELLEFPNNYPCTTSQQQDGSVDHHDYDNPNHDDEQIFLCGLESFNKQCQEKYCASHDFGIILPPFPGQEAMLLSSSRDQASQVVPPVVGPEVDDHHHPHHYQQEDNLFSSCNCWSIFDLPSDDHDIDSTFSGSHDEKI